MSSILELKMRLEAYRRQISYCSACNGEMQAAHILVCAECLDDECQNFSDLLENNLESDYASEFSGKE